MIVSGRVRDIYVTNASSEYRQGFKGRWTGRYVSDGVIHVRNGFGGQRDITSKRITLVVEVGNRIVEVWISRDFRFALGNLSKKRTQAIIDATPDEVLLYENENRKGERYYCLTDESLNSWLGRLSL